MKKPTLEQLVARTTNILANLVTVIQKRGDYNLDEYSNKIAALYSSQEPQKSEKQKVADLLGVPLSEVHTLDIQDGKLVEIVDVPQSVSTPTEGMELTQEQINIELFNYAYQIVTSNPIKDWNYNELIKQISKAQVAKVLKNLPTKQGIREKTQDKIARDLYKIIADNNYDMASVIRYLDKIVKLKAGQSPKEV